MHGHLLLVCSITMLSPALNNDITYYHSTSMLPSSVLCRAWVGDSREQFIISTALEAELCHFSFFEHVHPALHLMVFTSIETSTILGHLLWHWWCPCYPFLQSLSHKSPSALWCFLSHWKLSILSAFGSLVLLGKPLALEYALTHRGATLTSKGATFSVYFLFLGTWSHAAHLTAQKGIIH